MQTRPTDIISAMLGILDVVEEACADKQTLRKLIAIASDRDQWPEGHALFREIRRKTLLAEQQGDRCASVQYAFEEICAKTIYNLSHPPAPFDADSAFWVLPLAVDLGRALSFEDPADLTPLLRK